MKNIHILPTDKPSKLFYDLHNVLKLAENVLLFNVAEKKQNIYITSDEEIKEGNWCIDDIEDVFKIDNLEYFKKFCKKIILTTDQDLIQNGLQAIPDEFLEWFVKNPSCENVEIKFSCLEIKQCMCESNAKCLKLGYKIIIPQEETEFDRINQNFVNVQSEKINKWVEKNKNKIFPKEELKQDYNGVHLTHCYQGEYKDSCKYGENDCPAKPKQETLEEALDNYSNNPFTRAGFINGVNWQKERSFTLNQIDELFIGNNGGYFDDFLDYRLGWNGNQGKNKISFKEWFEQFKKKIK